MVKTIDERNALVEENLPLAYYWAAKYRFSGMELEDLQMMAAEGLMRAAEHFDASKGYEFSTYATYWIKSSLMKGMEKEGRTIRLPNWMEQMVQKVERVRRELTVLSGKEPTVAMLAEETGLSPERVEEALGFAYRVESLDSAVSEEGDTELVDMIPDKLAVDPQEWAEHADLREQIEFILKNLPKREADVLRLRFGFDREPMALEEVGRFFGISKERARQIEERALARIRRRPSMMARLAEYERE